MSRKIGVIGAIGAAALLALSVSACGDTGSTDSSGGEREPESGRGGQHDARVESQLPGVVRARVGDTLTVTLHSNSSTGYQWVTQDLSDAAVLKQVGDAKIVAPKSKLAGAPGHTQFTFEVDGRGRGRGRLLVPAAGRGRGGGHLGARRPRRRRPRAGQRGRR